MAYRIEKNQETGNRELVIDGFEKGIASSPYNGIGNIQNCGVTYYPGVAYVNYRRREASTSGTGWYAGVNSTNVSGNLGWIFTASTGVTMTNPVQKAVSPTGLIYILDDSGQIFKQDTVNATTFTELEDGTGRIAHGAAGLAYWNNYLVVFGSSIIEFCGDGTGDAGILSTNWNLVSSTSGILKNTSEFVTNFGSSTSNITIVTPAISLPKFVVGDPIQLTTTGTLPTGLSLLTTYYIKTLSGNVFTISTTIGGAAVTFSSDGTGTHTVTDNVLPLPIGNCTSFVSGSLTLGGTTTTIDSYVNPLGVTVQDIWYGATGIYDIIMADNQKVPALFTFGSSTVTFSSPLLYAATGSWSIQLLNPNVTFYRPYVSKSNGVLLFCNGNKIGRITEVASQNISFNPGLPITYSVNSRVTSIPEFDSTVDMVDLKSNLIVAGTYNTYTWDYLSAQCTSPSPVGEQIFTIWNLLDNIYILAGQKGNLYVSNGYSSQLLVKMSDFIAGIIDPVWSWGGIMTHRSKLFFQAFAKTVTGTNILAGIFSLAVSPTMLAEQAPAMVMEAQNSYGLTPVSGALSNGFLIDNSPSASGNDSYYSAWSNGAATGGIDYNDTSGWQNFEPTIETDIVPIGDILGKMTFGNISFKLDRPLVTGDQIRMYWRPSLTDSYTLMGTTTTAQLSDYYKSNITQSQWVQFKVQMKSASSGSSFIPLREVRLHFS